MGDTFVEMTNRLYDEMKYIDDPIVYKLDYYIITWIQQTGNFNYDLDKIHSWFVDENPSFQSVCRDIRRFAILHYIRIFKYKNDKDDYMGAAVLQDIEFAINCA